MKTITKKTLLLLSAVSMTALPTIAWGSAAAETTEPQPTTTAPKSILRPGESTNLEAHYWLKANATIQEVGDRTTAAVPQQIDLIKELADKLGITAADTDKILMENLPQNPTAPLVFAIRLKALQEDSLIPQDFSFEIPSSKVEVTLADYIKSLSSNGIHPTNSTGLEVYTAARGFKGIKNNLLFLTNPSQPINIQAVLSDKVPLLFVRAVYPSGEEQHLNNIRLIPLPEGSLTIPQEWQICCILGYENKEGKLWLNIMDEKGKAQLPVEYIEKGLAKDFWGIGNLGELVSIRLQDPQRGVVEKVEEGLEKLQASTSVLPQTAIQDIGAGCQAVKKQVLDMRSQLRQLLGGEIVQSTYPTLLGQVTKLKTERAAKEAAEKAAQKALEPLGEASETEAPSAEVSKETTVEITTKESGEITQASDQQAPATEPVAQQ